MKIVIAPNAFKGSLRASEAITAIQEGIAKVFPDADIHAVGVADGGDGLVEILHSSLGGELRRIPVHDPLGRLIEAEYLFLDKSSTAVVEMAKASGLALLRDRPKDIMRASTAGTGEILQHALHKGARRIILGLGGSATCDGGAGMAAALGARFLNAEGAVVDPVPLTFASIDSVDLSALQAECSGVEVTAVCDVDNPLLGARGAAAIYAPQKGATAEQVPLLEQGLAHLADILAKSTGHDVRETPGTGAAGGVGAGVLWFLDGTLKPGVDTVLDLVGFDTLLAGADLVFTAEGAMDRQTAFGKAPAGVAKRAKARGIPCFALAGAIAPDIEPLYALGFTAFRSICSQPMTLEQAMIDAHGLLARAAEQMLRAYLSAR